MTDYLKAKDCHRPKDMERLDPLDAVRLASMPMTRLDLMEIELRFAERFDRQTEAFMKALAKR